MKIRRHIDNYNFIADQETGMTFRWGKTFNDNPKFAPVPELVDISISNHCSKGCDFCYRDSKLNNSFMSLNDFEYILKKLKHPKYGNVFQVALGGGEPLEHPDFIKFIELACEYNIVPNFTTNGFHLNESVGEQIRGKVGAVAISINDISKLKEQKYEILLKNGIKTNIHYVLNRNNLIEAIDILKGNYNSELKGINAIVFLTFKPSGRGQAELVIENSDTLLHFVELIDKNKCVCNIGFDACFVPLLMYYTKTNINYIDSCEVGYFSLYIDENLNVSPCSFSNSKDSFNLKDYDFYDIWLNKFKDFRNKVNNTCTQLCNSHDECKGYCPYYPEITTCFKN